MVGDDPDGASTPAPSRPDAAGSLLSVLVAVTTCDRPDGLADLLRSFDALILPADCNVRFLVVENGAARLDPAATPPPFARIAGKPLDYLVEPEQGIPFARNRALDAGLAGRFDLMTFVDDDEIVDPDWLAALVGSYRSDPRNLLGGPVLARPPSGHLTRRQEFLMRGHSDWYQKRETNNLRLVAVGRESSFFIVTNNWLVDLAFVREHGLRFSEAYRISGGSDVDFCWQVRRNSGTTGWCETAIVRETISRERLTMRYIMFRATQQKINQIGRIRFRDNPLRIARQFAAFPPLIAYGLLRIALAPVAGPYWIIAGCRCIGGAVGGVLGALGAKSRLYRSGT